MKKTISLLFSQLCLSTFLCASDVELNAMVMINMENGLASIQKGFLYNNLDLIKKGVEQVSKENMIYQDRSVIKSILPENKQQMENLALITSKRIENSADEMKVFIALGQVKKAHNAFSDMINACTDCHTLIRGW